ncbi:histidine phosphatase superfamily [Chaetomium strumarium]|uniref:Histidine phosphatase superfamily n=1 Tax=Chaetomium strumarium TaxID=1170767 RepID=A0AAJ0GP89_9PEZI|nr:histidine phosphatase superfamily [Chaetomium strumarium]
MAATPVKRRYTAVAGFFEQDYASNSLSSKEGVSTTTLPGLGLIDRPYDTDEAFDPRREKHAWERFAHYLDHLNTTSAGKAVYKLIYAARHGEGYHNVKEREVGTRAWESHWAKLDGDEKTIWADAHLTERGIGQAQAMKTFWETSASTLGLPLPRRHYASPLARCLETCELAFSDLTVSSSSSSSNHHHGTEKIVVVIPPFKPAIKELLRERLGVHTCDRRRTRTWIREHHPVFAIEDGFAEQDELWRPDVRETLLEHAARVEGFLDDLFANDGETVVSVTAHSGTIHALYAAIGHEEVRVAPGGIVPVLIKAEI